MTRTTRRLLPVHVALLVLVALSGIACDVVFQGANAQATGEWKRSYKLEEGSQFELVNPNGSIDVSPSADATSVEVTGEIRVRAASEQAAREQLKALVIKEQATPRQIRIEVPRSPGGSGMHFGSHGYEVSFRVKVPKGTNVKVETRNGEVRVAGLSGTVNVDSTNGNIVAENLSGAVSAGTTNGNLRVQVTTIRPDGIRLETTNGDVELKIPADSKANIGAHWLNGDFETSGVSPQGESERRHYQGKLNGGGPPIELNTTNGRIRISS